MRSCIRAVVLWLVILAIPAQSMAMLSMPWCASSHHASVQHAPVAASAVPAAAVDRGAGHAHAGHGGIMHPSVKADVGAASGPALAGDADHDMLGCCSATCAVAVLGVASAVASVLPVTAGLAQAVASQYRGVTLDGLERPPRPLLA
jgi:hypothetical protein